MTPSDLAYRGRWPSMPGQRVVLRHWAAAGHVSVRPAGRARGAAPCFAAGPAMSTQRRFGQLLGSDDARAEHPGQHGLRVGDKPADEELAPGVRSVAAPVRDGHGTVRAAMNITVHAAETSTERLLNEHLPLLLRTAGEVSAEWARWQSRPHVELPMPRHDQPAATA